jgi:hypothetical protein
VAEGIGKVCFDLTWREIGNLEWFMRNVVYMTVMNKEFALQ